MAIDDTFVAGLGGYEELERQLNGRPGPRDPRHPEEYEGKDYYGRDLEQKDERSNERIARDEALRQLQYLWDEVPELEQLQLGESALAGAQADPAAIAAQRSAAREIEAIIRHKGLTPQDQARMEQLAMMNRGNQEAITGNLAARGMGGSGVEAVQRMMAQQGAAQRSTQVQADAADRVRQAIGMQAQLGGQMREQSFAEEATRGGAKDARDRYNAGTVQQDFLNRMGVRSGTSGAWERWAAAERGEQARSDAEDASFKNSLIQGGAGLAGSLLGLFAGGPGGAAVGGSLGYGAAKALTKDD